MLLCFRSTLTTKVWPSKTIPCNSTHCLYILTLHLFYEVHLRYHIHVIPVLILIACAGLIAFESNDTQATSKSRTPEPIKPPKQ